MESSQSVINSSKIDRRIRRTKEAISSAFLQLLKEKDIAKITVKELCEKADINRKTFYTYYSNASSVLTEIENDIIKQFKDSVTSIKTRKAILDIADIFVCIEGLLNIHLKFINQLVRADALSSLQNKIKTTIKEAIFEVMLNDNQYNNKILSLTLEYIVSGAVSIYINWFYSKDTIALSELSKLANQFVFSNTQIALAFSQSK